MTESRPDVGLILSGGGARGAYQVGVLKAVAELTPSRCHSPFRIICGTSAGAINAASLASNAHRFRMGVRGLEIVWRNLTADQVFHTELLAFVRMLCRWLIPGVTVGYTPHNSALLDNSPLRDLLTMVLKPRRIEEAIDKGYLKALSITASSYSNGESVAFYQAKHDVAPWDRVRRFGKPAVITVDHLLASSSIPLLFPAQKVGSDFYGDGALRQLAPLSPAVHLGADKIMVIGVSGNTTAEALPHVQRYPSMAQVLGHVLNSVFVDTLEGDVERLERINRTLAATTKEQRKTSLRPIDVLKVYPSQPIDEIAASHLHELPRSLRFFLRSAGGGHAAGDTGAAAVSYLLFHPGFCRALINLGYRDGMARKAQIREFLDLDAMPSTVGMPTENP